MGLQALAAMAPAPTPERGNGGACDGGSRDGGDGKMARGDGGWGGQGWGWMMI